MIKCIEMTVYFILLLRGFRLYPILLYPGQLYISAP